MAYLPQDQGWMSEGELAALERWALIETASLPGVILELGSYRGLSTSALTLGGTVVCVDTWDGRALDRPGEGNGSYEAFLGNMRRLGRMDRVVALRMPTQEALKILRGTAVRLALIDADHSEAAVYADAVGVWELLVPCGMVAFDDANRPGVRAALDRLAKEKGLDVKRATGKLAWVRKLG
jgi:predicted O-methyltransferase YrrM